jgi:hypothetical protein
MRVGRLTRCCSRLRSPRGGIGFPATPPTRGGIADTWAAALAADAEVVLRAPADISRTLNPSGKHRGLRFDSDMIKHSRNRFRLKTPRIILDEVDYFGEFLNFNAQHDFFYWRDSWLQPVEQDTATPLEPA